MSRLIAQASGWAVSAAVVALVATMIVLRPAIDPADASPSASPVSIPTAVPAALTGVELVAEPQARRVRQPPRLTSPEPTATPRPTPVPTPVPSPVPTPEPTPVPVVPAAAPATPAPTPVPVAAAPTDAGAGGPIGPLRTPPPGWVPPTSAPGDVIVEARIGQSASAGGISVSVSRLAGVTEGARMCESGYTGDAGLPPGYEWSGFRAKTTWSGFALDWPGGASNGNLYPACYHGGDPFTSGVTYEVWVAVPAGTGATAMLELGYFPNSASPAYIFRFR